ncbi:MAG: ATP-binding protein [Pseudomonadota bacterium]
MRRLLAWIGRRRPWPATLVGQLICLTLLALIVSQIVAALFFFGERRRAVEAAFAAEALARAASVALLLERTPETEHRRILAASSTPLARLSLARRSAIAQNGRDRRSLFLRREFLVRLREHSDRDWRNRVRVAVLPLRREAGQLDDRRGRPRTIGPQQLLASLRIGDRRWLTLRARFPRPPLQWAWPIAAQLGLSALAIVSVLALTIGRTTGSLRRLAKAAERFGRGAQSEPVPPSGPIEAKNLIASFNAMQERLSRFISDRTRLLAAISHDLRTPITTMRLRSELLEDGETKTKLLEGLEEMQRTVEATLAFAKEEATQEPMRTIDLSALVESVVEDAQELGLPVELGLLTSAVVEGRTVALKRALRNLVENAVRYGGAARIGLHVRSSMAEITIEDDGPGLPADSLEAMFEPFVRLEASRNRETGGVGLGLPIARSVLRAHGGDVQLAKRETGGLSAMMSLPLRLRGKG